MKEFTSRRRLTLCLFGLGACGFALDYVYTRINEHGAARDITLAQFCTISEIDAALAHREQEKAAPIKRQLYMEQKPFTLYIKPQNQINAGRLEKTIACYSMDACGIL